MSMSKFFPLLIQQQLDVVSCTYIHSCSFFFFPQLICSRKNKTQEVKQKISDYLEGKDTDIS